MRDKAMAALAQVQKSRLWRATESTSHSACIPYVVARDIIGASFMPGVMPPRRAEKASERHPAKAAKIRYVAAKTQYLRSAPSTYRDALELSPHYTPWKDCCGPSRDNVSSLSQPQGATTL